MWQIPNYWNNDCFDDVYYRNGEPVKTEGYCTDLWFKETISFIEKSTENGKPFFVYLPTSAMHTPQFVPAKYIEAYKEHPDLIAYFLGMIANFDENYGKLDATLERLGIKEDTILIYMSDNGGTLEVDVYNAGMTGRKSHLQDGGHRVPCFLRWPAGIASVGRDIDELTIIQDILPTLIDLCGLDMPWPQNFDGTSLKKIIMGEDQNLESRMSVVQFSTKRVGLSGYSVQWNKWRLVDKTDGVQDGEKVMLYHVGNDPSQQSNVAGENPEIVKAMQDYYTDWRKSVEPSLAKNSKIAIGYPGFESIELTSFDWLEIEGEGDPSQQQAVRQGLEMHGSWNLDVMETDVYELIFRRWPKETDTEISAGTPAYFTEFSKQIGRDAIPPSDKVPIWRIIVPDGVYPTGKALPITQVRFSSGGIKTTQPVIASDKSIRFEFELPAGGNKLQADFLDEQGNILCGAYYVDIKRLSKK